MASTTKFLLSSICTNGIDSRGCPGQFRAEENDERTKKHKEEDGRPDVSEGNGERGEDSGEEKDGDDIQEITSLSSYVVRISL